MITIWLAWTLLSGQPVDVNSYMTEDSCKASVVEAQEMLSHARHQNAQVPDYAIVGCQAVPVQAGAKQNAS